MSEAGGCVIGKEKRVIYLEKQGQGFGRDSKLWP
jgi:hypothetical protein